MRFLLRFTSLLLLILAILAGTFDSIRSISERKVALASVASTVGMLQPVYPALAKRIPPSYMDADGGTWAGRLSSVPAFAAFLVLSLLFWMAGYKKQRCVSGPVPGRL